MNVLSTLCGCGIHLYIIIRLVANFDKMSQYKGFIVAQSVVYVIDSLIVLLFNYVYSDELESFGLPFLPISQQTATVLRILMQVVVELDFISMLLTTFEALPVFVCYVIIYRHFRNITTSDRVRRMQNKLSAGLLMLMLIQFVNNVISWTYFLISEKYILWASSDEAIITINRIYVTVGG
ncbi:hypothetical protein Aduo_010821 [Ancylostoma duodenale]